MVISLRVSCSISNHYGKTLTASKRLILDMLHNSAKIRLFTSNDVVIHIAGLVVFFLSQ